MDHNVQIATVVGSYNGTRGTFIHSCRAKAGVTVICDVRGCLLHVVVHVCGVLHKKEDRDDDNIDYGMNMMVVEGGVVWRMKMAG